MSHELLANLCALATLLGFIAYTLLGGADFGGGVWNLFSFGPRKTEQREAIAHAMGPVWEANHVWLIFVIVMLFTCFPRGFGPICVALFVPLHLLLLGIMLRGASFIFRKVADETKPGHQTTDRATRSFSAWGLIFGVASTISPLLLGICFGVVTSGVIHVDSAGNVTFDSHAMPGGITPYAIGCGFLALSTCSYLAAVYLVVETRGKLREDFRRRAIISGTTTALLAIVVLFLMKREATWFTSRLLSTNASPILSAGLVLFAAAAVAVFRRHYLLSCVCAICEVAVLLVGWGVAYHDYLIYPDVPLLASAAPATTLRFVLISLPIGLALLLPSLWMLFHVFKAGHVTKSQS